MKVLMLFQFAVTTVIYLIVFARPWFRSLRLNDLHKESKPAYFVGLLFAGLFYYGAPLWLWLYGWRLAILLIVSCLGGTFVVFMITSLIIPFEESEKLPVGILIQLLIRVVVGGWLAHNHIRLRD